MSGLGNALGGGLEVEMIRGSKELEVLLLVWVLFSVVDSGAGGFGGRRSVLLLGVPLMQTVGVFGMFYINIKIRPHSYSTTLGVRCTEATLLADAAALFCFCSSVRGL